MFFVNSITSSKGILLLIGREVQSSQELSRMVFLVLLTGLYGLSKSTAGLQRRLWHDTTVTF